jgi:hypothetical protein
MAISGPSAAPAANVRRAGRVTAALGLLTVLAACGGDGGPTGTQNRATAVAIQGGDLQRGAAGSLLGEPLQVTVKNAANAPVQGAVVRFRVLNGASTGTTVSDSAAVSGLDGIARIEVRLGAVLDTSRIEASLPNVTGASAAVTFRVLATTPPTLASVTPATFLPGDTVRIRGRNFNTTAAGNTVLFTNARGRVVRGDADSVLVVVVPPCVSSGPVTVRVLVGTAPTNTVNATVNSGSPILSLAQFEGIAVSGTELGDCLRLAGGGASYLLVPQSAGSNDGTRRIDFRLTSNSAVTDLLFDRSAVLPTRQSDIPLQYQLDQTLRRREGELAREYADALRPSPIEITPRIQAAVPALGSTRSFSVLSSLSTINFTNTTGRLRYVGSHILIYVDTDQPAGTLTDAEIRSLGDLFDKDLYSLNVRTFGSESDVDNDGRVIVLMSPLINTLTPSAQCQSQGFVTGFFFGNDLIPRARGSNGSEMFYALVPDSLGTKSCAHSRAQVMRLVQATFIHEFQHMISYNQHVLARGGSEETLWLNEGLSHIAEELGSRVFESRYPPPSGRADPAQLFPDSSQGFITGDMLNAYRYLATSSASSVTALSGAGTLEERGAAWLFLRWLGDQKGEGIYARLVQTSRTGTTNVEDKAGESFAGLFGDFATAVYTDSIVGVPRANIPARLKFTSRNFRRIFQRFFDTQTQGVTAAFPFVPRPLNPIGVVTSSFVQGTMEYYRVDTQASQPSIALRFSRPDGSAFLANDAVQIGVFRLR